MRTVLLDLLKKTSLVLRESAASFGRNNDLAAASSLAFSAMLALVPALFLLTSLLGIAVGSSQEAFRAVQEMLDRLLPAYSKEVLQEVRYIASHKRTFGVLNFLVFALAVTPLIGDLRLALGRIFRARPGRSFLIEKLLDAAITVVFLLGIAAITLVGVAFTVAERIMDLPELPTVLNGMVPFLFIAGTMTLLYRAFGRESRLPVLAAGAATAAALWFALRPLFHLMLVYNPGYGLVFGSFKSLFVVVIWIFYSLIVFLYGAELAAAIGRRETVYIKRLLQRGGSLSASAFARHVLRFERGSLVFGDGDPGDCMFYVLSGAVSIRKGERELSAVGPGQYVGVASFLLDSPRIAAAVAVDDAELVVISRENITHLMHESPEIVITILKEIAVRLRETNKLIE